LSFLTISIAYDKRALDFLRDTTARADKLHDMAGHERYFENAEYTHHGLVWSFHARHIGFERRSGEPVSQRVLPPDARHVGPSARTEVVRAGKRAHGMSDTILALAEKLAVVTGASGGIGSAVALRLAQDGASVVVHYNSSREDAEAVVRQIVATGGKAEAVGADLAHPKGPAALIDRLDTSFGGRFRGRLDVLVNIAGTLEFGSLAEVSDESFDRLFNVNVRACFQLSREAATRMTKTGWGRIINMGSVFGEGAPMPGLGIYCGTKFAVRGLTRAWSRDLGPAGVTVNNIQPALIQKEPLPTHGPAYEAMQRFNSVGRFSSPRDIAEAVAFLASPSAGYINGESLTVDGGWSA